MRMARLITVFLALTILSMSVSAEATILPSSRPSNETVTLHLFWREGCPHCAAEKEFLKDVQARHPELEVALYEVGDQGNRRLFEEFAKKANCSTQYVPATFIGPRFIGGFDNSYLIGAKIESAVEDEITCMRDPQACKRPTEDNSICLPIIGTVDPEDVSLPVFTVILGALDSFNPCAFFVLFFLLSLMVHAQSRARMLIIGGVFVFFSGFIYFLFMAAWLNTFLLIGQAQFITFAAGLVALVVAALNIKDYLYFGQGPSLSISDEAKTKLFAKMRNLVKATELSSMIAGTALLAVAANTYELLCTAGFPVVYTRVLTLSHLPSSDYYLYLALYNIVYVIPLTVIVVFFTWTLGRRKLTETEGRILKLLSGVMMLSLGLILVFAPNLLNNLLAAAGILVVSALVTALIHIITPKEPKNSLKRQN